MKKKSSPRLSLVTALCWIVGSTVIFSTVSHKMIRYVFYKKNKSKQESKIEYIVQTGPCKEALSSTYLSEMLGLSVDKPVFFSAFNEMDQQKKILSFPIIREAYIKKIAPNMVYIDYALRKPIAWASDFLNTALDREGTLFPMHPFFSPKKISEIYLGSIGLQESGVPALGSCLKGKYIDLAYALLDLLNEKSKDLFFVKKIDVSQAFAPTLGKREIVLILEQDLYLPQEEQPVLARHFLRLSLKHFEEEIDNYLKLRKSLLEADQHERSFLNTMMVKERVIDLRLPQLAFIQ